MIVVSSLRESGTVSDEEGVEEERDALAMRERTGEKIAETEKLRSAREQH